MNRRLLMAVTLAALQLCAAAPAAEGRGPATAQGKTRKVRRRAPDALLPGAWGGPHVGLTVTETGARVEYDCAHGTVEGKVVVDGRGRFSVYGRHFEEHGGPVHATEIREGGEGGGGYPVRLSGRVGGSLMKLTVTRTDTREVIGTFNLARDREPHLVKCR